MNKSFIFLIGFLLFSSYAKGQSSYIKVSSTAYCGGTYYYSIRSASNPSLTLTARWTLEEPDGNLIQLATNRVHGVNASFNSTGSYKLTAYDVSNGYPLSQININPKGIKLDMPGLIIVTGNMNVIDGPHLCNGNVGTVDIAPVSSAVNYRWEAPSGWQFPNGNNVYYTTSTNPISITAPALGNGIASIKVRAQDNNDACETPSAYRTVLISYGAQANLISGPTTVYPNEGRSYTLDDRGIENGSISWNTPVGWTLNSQNGAAIAFFNTGNSLPGAYSVTATYQSCGQTLSVSLPVTLESGSGGGIVIDPGFGRPTLDTELEVAELTLYPNPATDLVTVHSPKSLASIRVLSLSGKEVTTVVAQGDKTSFSVSSLSEGFYLVETVNADGEIKISRLLVK